MKASCILVLIVLLSVEHDCLNTSQNVNVTEIIDSLLVNYDKRLRPNFNGAPVDVGVTLYVISLRDLSDIDMEYTMDFYFRQFWTDTRLSFEKKRNLETLSLGFEFRNQIWIPDTFFVNEKESLIHTVTTKNEFLRVEHDGKITRSVRLTVTASCPMNLHRFPMDTQKCELEMESYGHTAKDVRYSWKENGTSVGVGHDVYLGSFELIGHEEKTEHLELLSGNYSRLAVEFEFKRSIEFYRCQVYVPCTMLVILAWISLCVNRKAVNVRLALAVLAMLLMTIGCQSIGHHIPKTSYPKAIDVFTGVSLTFIFFALVEFAYIRSCLCDNDKDDDFDSTPAKVDKFFRIGYPIAFVVFNILYWTIY